jgi:hypothetical protein
MRFIEASAAFLVRAGLTPLQALEAINGGAALVIGSVLVEAGETPGSEPIEQRTIDEAYGQLVPAEFPTIAAVTAAAAIETFDPEVQFEALLDAYVRGLEQRLGRR